MTRNILTVLLCAFVATFAVVASIPSTSQQKALDLLQNSTDEWEFVGFINGKLIIKHNESVSWMEGREICKSVNYEFATLENVDEYSLVRSKATAPEGIWVSAIMRGAEQFRPLAFNWDTNGGAISDDLNYHMFAEHWICLYYSGDDHLYSDYCLSGRHQTLCQFIVWH